jgi:hypothetical protein
VITYCVSVLPVYWGFAIFGVLNFGPYSEKFSGVSQTIVTLFSLLNGDDIYATFAEIEEGQFPSVALSRIYIITFVTLFVTSVLNVFIFIIEDSYRQAKLSALNRSDDDFSAPEDALGGREVLHVIFHNLAVWENRIHENPGFYFPADYIPSSAGWQSATYPDDQEEEEGVSIPIPMQDIDIEISPPDDQEEETSPESPLLSTPSSDLQPLDLHDQRPNSLDVPRSTSPGLEARSGSSENIPRVSPQRRKISGRGVLKSSDPTMIRSSRDSLRRSGTSGTLPISKGNLSSIPTSGLRRPSPIGLSLQTALAEQEAMKGDLPQLLQLLERQITSQRNLFEEELQQKEEELKLLRKQFNEQQTLLLNLSKLIGSTYNQSSNPRLL